MIQAHNADKKQTWTMEINEHADLTFEEFRAQRLMVGQGKIYWNFKHEF